MSGSALAKRIRAVLREATAPMSIAEITARVKARETSVRRTVAFNMPDAFIKDWREVPNVRSIQLWAVVVPPPNAPAPHRKSSPTTKAKTKKSAVCVKKARRTLPANYTPQGLTQIRGPWPTH